MWGGGARGEDEALASCYRECLALAAEQSAASIAFPAISTGAYGFPPRRAAAIALREVRVFLKGHPGIEVRFVCFDEETYGIYRELIGGN